jgi:PAS domain S-box-containing protein
MDSSLDRLQELHSILFKEDIDFSKSSVNILDFKSDNFEEYNILVSEIPICVHSISTDGKIRSINKAGIAMLGYESEDSIIGTDYLSYIHKHDLLRISNLLKDAIDFGKKSKFEFKSVDGKMYSSMFIPIIKESKTIKVLGYTQILNKN